MACLKWKDHGFHFLFQPEKMFGISACIFLLVVHFYKQPNLR